MLQYLIDDSHLIAGNGVYRAQPQDDHSYPKHFLEHNDMTLAKESIRAPERVMVP